MSDKPDPNCTCSEEGYWGDGPCITCESKTEEDELMKAGIAMNKTEAIKLLTTDVAAWNKYRDEHREWWPDLEGADLVGADLRGSDLWGADLVGADLGYADLGGADLRGSDLRNSDLRGSDLWGASLEGANLEGAKLTRSQVQPWIGEPDWQETEEDE